VKFLLDQNLSPRLCDQLRDVLLDLVHVRDLGLERADDAVIWRYAREHSLAVITKDADFNNLAFLFGAPPKVVWIQLGNCSTGEIESLLRTRRDDLVAFESDPDGALLLLP
jgi:predicted nuclease of predicted toxin-antitoxin system